MDENLNSRITHGLERIAEAIQALLWEKAKVHGLSPIQIKILFFVSKHGAELCNVSQLAKEFNVTKPTISDAVRVLDKKGWVEKDYSSSDSRSFSLFLSTQGKDLLKELGQYTYPLEQAIHPLETHQKEAIHATLIQLIHQLNKAGVLQVQRTCLGCRFHEMQGENHYCHFLQSPLTVANLQVDCPDFQAA
ncbi:MarR family transcriptional regulator [bacterium SCSIO 12741]|nr:MarR family transcriptional regulator [bacterium SCSIO 12741]